MKLFPSSNLCFALGRIGGGASTVVSATVCLGDGQKQGQTARIFASNEKNGLVPPPILSKLIKVSENSISFDDRIKRMIFLQASPRRLVQCITNICLNQRE